MNYSRKQQVATAIAIAFHLIGLTGILMKHDFFIHATSINLFLMFLLVLYTQPHPGRSFFLFIVSCFIIGFGTEIIGTKTGLLFGNYKYGDVLGPEIGDVPLIIGINWFLVIYCCGITISYVLNKLQSATEVNPRTRTASLLIDSAILAVLFDWIMEPVAVKLGYWTWEGNIPLSNYLTWFIVSIILMITFRYAAFNTNNKFAVNLLLIQMMFFLLLRTFL